MILFAERFLTIYGLKGITMNLSDIQLLFEYNYWANQLILDKAKELSHEQLVEPTIFSYVNLLETLKHTLDSEYVWRTIFMNKRFSGRLVDEELFPTLESVISYWVKEREYLNSLTDSDMESILRYDIPEGVRERTLWHCLVHIVNHGTQHRSESATMLTNFGHSPGDIDFSVYLRQT